jgi:hypothetical protein
MYCSSPFLVVSLPEHHLFYLEGNIIDDRFLKISSKDYETDLWHATQSRTGHSAIWWLIAGQGAFLIRTALQKRTIVEFSLQGRSGMATCVVE